jgi:dTMP kinase
MENKPLFITFEGGEGSGKSTQAKLFYDFFKEKYGNAVLTREPGGVKESEQIREIILNPDNNLTGITELFLFEAARTEFVKKIVHPNIQNGISVISDRFYDSTTVYQGYGRGLPIQIINELNSLASNLYNPDLTFIIHVPIKTGLENAKKRGLLNRLDKESDEFHEKVRKGFFIVAEDNPERCVSINYEEGIERVQEKIRNEFSIRYNL